MFCFDSCGCGLIVGVVACGLGCCGFGFLDCVVLLFLFGFWVGRLIDFSGVGDCWLYGCGW